MKYEIVNSRSRGFTLVEMLVAVALLAVTLGAMGAIFRMSMDAYRASSATSEVMRKLRSITEQLNADFKGLRASDGMVLAAWKVAEDKNYTDYTTDPNALYHRDDKILLFASGDFQSYDDQAGKGVSKAVKGNVARISYMMANDKDGWRPEEYMDTSGVPISTTKDMRDERRRTRVLARSQHIVTADPCFTDTTTSPLVPFPLFSQLGRISNNATALDAAKRNNIIEFDTDGLQGWADATVEDFLPGWQPGLLTMLTVCLGVPIPDDITGTGSFGRYGGLQVSPDNPQDVHLILAQGVRDLQIQVWAGGRWIPQTGTFDSAGNIVGTDFFTTVVNGLTVIDTHRSYYYYSDPVAGRPFNYPAIKFTFKLYDSRGFFKQGLTFTHIVYLADNQ